MSCSQKPNTLKTATAALLLDFMFMQCEPLSIAEIKAQLTKQGAPIAIRTIRLHIDCICKDFPQRCQTIPSHHQYRRIPVKKYLLYPEQKKCN